MQHKLSDTTMVAELIPQPQSVRSRLCSCSKTAAHQYFVSRKTELYLKYGCNINGILECRIGEGMYPLCYHHHQRVVQWNKETNPDTDLKCHSVRTKTGKDCSGWGRAIVNLKKDCLSDVIVTSND